MMVIYLMQITIIILIAIYRLHLGSNLPIPHLQVCFQSGKPPAHYEFG